MKHRVVRIVIGLAFLLALASSSGIVADTLGLPLTSQVHACGPSTGGGGC